MKDDATKAMQISIHSLRKQRDAAAGARAAFEIQFQSTLCASRETSRLRSNCRSLFDFNPLSAQAERHNTVSFLVCSMNFNPLSAQAERRYRLHNQVFSKLISIHSLRKQRDCKYAQPLQSSHATVLCILNKSYNPNNNYHTITNHPQPFFQAFQVRRIQ